MKPNDRALSFLCVVMCSLVMHASCNSPKMHLWQGGVRRGAEGVGTQDGYHA